MIRVVKLKLTKKNEEPLRQVFRKCFTEKWSKSVPFPKDPVYAAFIDDVIVGFCMVHHEPPQKMKQGDGGYMYNLCVDPEYRRAKVGTAIVQQIMVDYPVCYAHMDQTGEYHTFMTKMGWTRIGAVRQFYEYAFIESEKVEECPEVKWNPRQYDAVNNVIYVDA